MASVEKAVKFSGKVKVEVIKKDKVPLFLKERDAKLTQEKIDFLKEELSKQENILNELEQDIKRLEQEKAGD